MTPAQLRQYGLTVEDFDALLKVQGGRCPLCERTFTTRRPPVIDHKHSDGRCRGLLCRWCNSLLGLLHDDAGWLGRGSRYLLSPPCNSVGVFIHKGAPPT